MGPFLVAFGLWASVCWSLFDEQTGERCARSIQREGIVSHLFNGDIISGREYKENDKKHALYLIHLRDPVTGEIMEAFFKPRFLGDEDGWSRTPMEFVAYYLNGLLGMDYVPPVAYRRWLWIEGQYFDEGAVIYRVSRINFLFDTPQAEWGLTRTAILSDYRILNVLLQNGDGHEDNLFMGDHWGDGQRSSFFIDFGASMRQGTYVSMTSYATRHPKLLLTSGSIYWVRERTLQRLRELSFDDLGPVLEFLSPEEAKGIIKRAEGIVAFFDKLIAEKGRDAVLLYE